MQIAYLRRFALKRDKHVQGSIRLADLTVTSWEVAGQDINEFILVMHVDRPLDDGIAPHVLST